MKKIAFIVVLLATLFSPESVIASKKIKLTPEQKKLHNEAYTLLVKNFFDNASRAYEKLIATKPDYDRFYFEAGVAYLNSSKKTYKAEAYFEQALKYSTEDTIPELYYFLAKSYQINYKFDKAINAFKKEIPYIKKSKAGQRFRKQLDWDIKTCENGINCFKSSKIDPLKNNSKAIKNIRKYALNPTDTIQLENLGGRINSSADELITVLINNENDIYTTSTKSPYGTAINISSSAIKQYEHVYTSTKKRGKWGTSLPSGISKLIEGHKHLDPKTNSSIVSINSDENVLFLNISGKLYKSNKTDGEWTLPTLLPEFINLKNANQSSVCLNKEGNMMFIVSDKKGGIGGKDIYLSRLNDDGTWGALENIGNAINTSQDEESPFIDNNGILYFSSKGHTSIGGYDIFYTQFKNEAWTKPTSLGIPINTPNNELGYIKSKKDKKSAYYSSFQLNGYGNNDIYKITYRIKKQKNLLPVIK